MQDKSSVPVPAQSSAPFFFVLKKMCKEMLVAPLLLACACKAGEEKSMRAVVCLYHSFLSVTHRALLL